MVFLSTIKTRMITSIGLTVLLIVLALGITLSGVSSINHSFEQYLQENQTRAHALNSKYEEGLKTNLESQPGREIRAAINNMKQQEQVAAEEARALAQSVVNKTYVTGVTIAVLAVLLVIIINFLIIRSILARTQIIRDHLHDLAVDDADLTWRLDVTESDEVTDMAKSINMFIARVQ